MQAILPRLHQSSLPYKYCPEGIETDKNWGNIRYKYLLYSRSVDQIFKFTSKSSASTELSFEKFIIRELRLAFTFFTYVRMWHFLETLIKFAKRQDGLIADSSQCQCNECKKDLLWQVFKDNFCLSLIIFPGEISF